MSLTAAVWPQFVMQVFWWGIGHLTCIGSYVNKQVTTFTVRAQTCSKHHTRTVMDAGCECAPWVRLANPSDSWASGHVTLLWVEYQPPILSPQSDLWHRVASRLALPQISSFNRALIAVLVHVLFVWPMTQQKAILQRNSGLSAGSTIPAGVIIGTSHCGDWKNRWC